MAHRTYSLNKILVPWVNCRPTGRFLTRLSAKIYCLCSKLCFFEPKHTTSTLCACESSHLHFNCGSFRSSGIGYYSTVCNKLAMFCYVITVRCVCPLYKFVYSFKVVRFSLKHPVQQDTYGQTTATRTYLCSSNQTKFLHPHTNSEYTIHQPTPPAKQRNICTILKKHDEMYFWTNGNYAKPPHYCV
jgi:hypothetical protein